MWSFLKRLAKVAPKYSIPGVLDEAAGAAFYNAFGMVSGFGKGILGKSLNLSNATMVNGTMQMLGYGVGKAGVAAAKPIIQVGAYLTKNTPRDFLKLTNAVKGAPGGAFNAMFKKAGANSISPFLGYEARAFTPTLLTLGAVGIGAGNARSKYDYNMALKTTVNGIMDTQGVAITPGSVNESYTPLFEQAKKGKKVKNFGASGDLPLALHNKRRSGFL